MQSTLQLSKDIQCFAAMPDATNFKISMRKDCINHDSSEDGQGKRDVKHIAHYPQFLALARIIGFQRYLAIFVRHFVSSEKPSLQIWGQTTHTAVLT